MMRWLSAALAVALAGCTASSLPFDEVPQPAWQAGYHFTHFVEGSATWDFESEEDGDTVRESGHDTLEPSPAYERRVLTTDVTWKEAPVYLVEMTLHDFAAGLGSEEDIEPYEPEPFLAVVDPRDLSTTGARVELDRSCDTCAPETRLEVDEWPDDFPQHPLFQFPLHSGDRWRTSFQEALDLDDVDVGLQAEVLGLERVDGPDGRVDAVHVRHRLYGISDLAQAIERAARDEGTQIDLSVKASFQMDLYYAPDLQDVVLSRAVLDFSGSVSYDDGETSGKGRGSLHVDVTERLTAASLVAALDPGLAGAVGVAAGAPPLLPASTPVQPVPGAAVQLSSDRVSLNTALAESVTFSAAWTGPGTVRVIIVAADGTVVAEGATAVVYEAAKPGTYWGVAELVADDGTVSARDRHAVSAYFEKTVPLTCPMVTVMQSCQGLNVDLGAGMFRATAVLATQSAVEGSAFPGELRVTVGDDLAGSAPANGSARVQAGVLGDATLTANWVDSVEVMPEAILALRVEPIDTESYFDEWQGGFRLAAPGLAPFGPLFGPGGLGGGLLGNPVPPAMSLARGWTEGSRPAL